MFLHYRLDDAQRVECGVFEISFTVARRLRRVLVREAAFGGNVVGLVFPAEDPARDGVVDDDVDAVASTGGDQLGFDGACDGVVHSLPDCGAHPVVVFAVHDYFCDLEGGEVAQAELDEFALFVHLVQFLQRLGEGDAAVCGVEVEDVDAVRPQFFETRVERCFEVLAAVCADCARVAFCCEGETAVFPFGFARVGFLFAGDVGAGGVDFVVALGLEVVEDGVVGLEGGDARAVFGGGTGCLLVVRGAGGGGREVCVPNGHEPEDDSGFAASCDERHPGGLAGGE